MASNNRVFRSTLRASHLQICVSHASNVCMFLAGAVSGFHLTFLTMAARSRPSWDPASQDEYFDLNYQETAERRPRAVSGPPPPPTTPVNDPEYALRTVFGFPSFRTRQLDIVRTALSGKDVFVIMPTGGGKSLCFQVRCLVLRAQFV